MRSKYLVVVYPAPPAMRDTQTFSTTPRRNDPTVKIVTVAGGPQAAAAEAGVQPGGYVLVTPYEDMHRYDRAAQAPLEAKKADGSPLDRGVSRAA